LFFLFKEPDGVDDILAAEKYHLNNIKKILELTCKNVADQMQVNYFDNL